MALYGVSFVLAYTAWDTTANAGKTVDAGNHTLRWVKDGVSSAPTNAPSEVDAVNLPGLYAIVITATEAQAVFGTLGGKSSTANVSIMPVMVPFERLPNAAPGTASGLPLLSDVTGGTTIVTSTIISAVSPPTRRRVVDTATPL